MMSTYIKKNTKHRFLAGLLSCMMIMSGCGSSAGEVPELLEPKSATESCRPVDYAKVTSDSVYMATVMPEEYCAFFTEAAKVNEICVDVGQYVEEGTVLARMDTSNLSAQLEAAQDSLSVTNEVYDYNMKIADERIKQMNYLRRDALDNNDEDAKKECDKQISILEENKSFETLMNNHRNIALKENISKLSETVDAAVLKAPHAGYVTYVKNLGKSDDATAYENIVIISDYNKLHLELDVNIGDKLYKSLCESYDDVYVMIDGQKISLTLCEYTNAELVAMQSVNMYTNIMFSFEGADNKLNMGDKLPVYVTTSQNKPGLRIGMDSLYTSGTESFVYVKTEYGKEKRVIETGKKNDLYVEVLSGLEEGEWVYYSSNAIVPEEYDTYEVEKSTYTISGSDIGIKGQKAHTKLYAYYWNDGGDVDKVYFDKGDTVKKGDLICTLKTKDGFGSRVELQNTINNLAEQKKTMLKSYDTQLEEIDKQIVAARAARDATEQETEVPADTATDTDATLATDGDANEEELPSKTVVERLQCDKHIKEYEKEISILQLDAASRQANRQFEELDKRNDGSGNIYIYANQDGIISQMYAYEGRTILEDMPILFKINTVESDKIAFQTGSDYVGVGSTVTITLEDGTTVEKEVIGNAGSERKCYLGYRKDKVYVTTCAAENKAYITYDGLPEDLELANADINYSRVRIPDAIAIPRRLVHEEKSDRSASTYYYVWKYIDGQIVKQYVDMQEEFNSKASMCILGGVEAGDVLIEEKVVTAK